MKIMRNRIFSILVAVAIVFSVTAATAQRAIGPQGKMDRKEMMKERGMRPDFNKANILTEEQREAMKEIRLEAAKKVKPLRNELRELHARQQTLTTADNADLKAINKNIDKMAEVRAEVAKIMAAQHQGFRSLLTEEQLLHFDSRRDKMHQGLNDRNKRNRLEKNAPPMQRRGA